VDDENDGVSEREYVTFVPKVDTERFELEEEAKKLYNVKPVVEETLIEFTLATILVEVELLAGS
jgi:hypothetical protein